MSKKKNKIELKSKLIYYGFLAFLLFGIFFFAKSLGILEAFRYEFSEEHRINIDNHKQFIDSKCESKIDDIKEIVDSYYGCSQLKYGYEFLTCKYINNDGEVIKREFDIKNEGDILEYCKDDYELYCGSWLFSPTLPCLTGGLF